MRTTTDMPDDDRRAVMFARIPERLTEEERRRRYDEPLTSMIREVGMGGLLRGFSQTGDDGAVAWVGIEVTLEDMQDRAFVAGCLVRLGAPAETVIEIDTEKASVECSLAAAAGG